jgi:hypothetical protein
MKPIIFVAIAMLALGVIAVQSNSAALVPIESHMFVQILPFDMMRNARGLPVEVSDNAI